MKTRTVLIYLGVFLVLVVCCYYFEVVRRQAHERQEEAARRLFQVDKTRVTALRVERAEAEPICLEKGDHWRIVQPITSRADEFTVDGILDTLESLQMEREIEAASRDLRGYGLDKPELQLSFRVGDTWHRLCVGAEAPVSDRFYASADQESRVVLIADFHRRSLNRNLFELRFKNLFTLTSGEVDRIELHHPGTEFLLVRHEEDHWQAPDRPEVRIKTAKVETLLDRLTWLRASRFVQKGEGDLPRFGLAPGTFHIAIAAGQQTESVLLGSRENDKGVYARSQQLPGVVLVDEAVVEQLPRSLSELEDRSLLSFESEQVAALRVALNGRTATVVRRGEQWRWEGNGDLQDPEAWLVVSLLWKLQELAYQSGAPPQRSSPPQEPQVSVVLFGGNEMQLCGVLLPEIPAAEEHREVVWAFQGGEQPQPHWVSRESLHGVEQSMNKLMAFEQQ
jgi:hypothetical protein